MLCMSKESKEVIKIHSNRLDIYIVMSKGSKVHHTELNTLNVNMSKESKVHHTELNTLNVNMLKESKASSIYTVGSNTKYSN